jgi:hypothetical protein
MRRDPHPPVRPDDAGARAGRRRHVLRVLRLLGAHHPRPLRGAPGGRGLAGRGTDRHRARRRREGGERHRPGHPLRLDPRGRRRRRGGAALLRAARPRHALGRRPDPRRAGGIRLADVGVPEVGRRRRRDLDATHPTRRRLRWSRRSGGARAEAACSRSPSSASRGPRRTRRSTRPTRCPSSPPTTGASSGAISRGRSSTRRDPVPSDVSC